MPIIVADTWRSVCGRPPLDADILERRSGTRIIMALLTSLPLIQVAALFTHVQQFYTVTGASFLQLLVLTLPSG